MMTMLLLHTMIIADLAVIYLSLFINAYKISQQRLYSIDSLGSQQCLCRFLGQSVAPLQIPQAVSMSMDGSTLMIILIKNCILVRIIKKKGAIRIVELEAALKAQETRDRVQRFGRTSKLYVVFGFVFILKKNKTIRDISFNHSLLWFLFSYLENMHGQHSVANCNAIRYTQILGLYHIYHLSVLGCLLTYLIHHLSAI